MGARIRWNGAWTPADVAAANAFERDLFGVSRAPRRPWAPSRRSAWSHEANDESERWGEVPVGTDDRVQVQAQARNPSTRLYPFATICMIEQNNGTSYVSHATGTLIAPQVVLTAGHVIALGSGVLPRVRVTPGADLSAASAADQTPASPGSQEATSTGLVRHPTLDLGLVFLPSAFTRPNRFMMLQPRGDQNTATLLTIAGYPREQPNTTPPVPIRGLMYRHTDRLQVTGVTATTLNYSIDTSVGQSGSPLWLLGNDSIRLLLGVHTTGAGTNYGVRITCAVIDWIENECRTRSVTGPIVDRVQQRRVCP